MVVWSHGGFIAVFVDSIAGATTWVRADHSPKAPDTMNGTEC